MSGAAETSNAARPDYIARVVNLIHEPKSIVELRCPKTHWKTISGYFSEYEKLAQEAATLSGQVPGVYITLNPVKPDLLARRANRIERYADQTTPDDDILKRRWLPIDFDPVRPAGISSTDMEKALSVTRAEECRAWLLSLGCPSGVSADSGNGAHLLYRVDLPNNAASAELIQKCLEAVAVWFTDDKVSVDLKNFNAARIWKLFGTVAAKGDNTKDRPHRPSKILTVPKNLEVVSLELLKKLASFAPEPQKHQSANNGHYQAFNLNDFITRHGIQVKHESGWKDGRRIVLETCPWNPDHDQGEAFIVQLANGAIGAGCQHNSCSYKKWPELREIYEPGYRERRSDNSHSQTKTNDAETHREEKAKPSPWTKAKSAPDFCAEEDKEIEGYAKALLYPGTITVIAAPRGIGKTLVLHALAVAIAKGEYFRGEKVSSLRVLLVDRDNPRQVVRQRIRGWGGGVLDAKNLKVLTREDAPDLKDKSAWEAFPVGDYDVVLIDSLGSFTEGVTEKEGKETTQMLATLLDFIRKGPAVVALTNCTKDALNTRGRGEWQDRVDIQYEVRDATAFTPSGKKDWWLELPEAGEAAWADRAARRKSRIDYRLAFIPSKFRLGAQPEPFCLEVRLPKDETWTLEDVTNDLVEAGESTIKEAAAKKTEQEEAAVKALAELVKERHAEKNPILKTEAEGYLNKEMEIPRKRCRELLKAQENILWEFHDVGGKGAGKGLFPRGKNSPAAKNNYEGKTAAARVPGGPQECDPHKPLENNGFLAEAFLPPREFTAGNGAADNAAGGDDDEEKYIREERAAIRGEDGFEDVPK